LLTKPKKVKIKSKKSAYAKIKEICGDMFEQIKPQKAMWQSKMSFYVDKGSINGKFSELCGFSKRGCAPLWERWRTPRGDCSYLERWCPSHPLVDPCVDRLDDWERW
jgi:hypothetical protein